MGGGSTWRWTRSCRSCGHRERPHEVSTARFEEKGKRQNKEHANAPLNDHHQRDSQELLRLLRDGRTATKRILELAARPLLDRVEDDRVGRIAEEGTATAETLGRDGEVEDFGLDGAGGADLGDDALAD